MSGGLRGLPVSAADCPVHIRASRFHAARPTRTGAAVTGDENQLQEDSMFQRILVAYDGSAPARKAYEVSLDLAKKYQAEVHVLAVARPPDFAEDVETEAALESAREHFGKQFGELESKAAHAGLKPHLRVVTGHPAEQVVGAVEQYHIDLIVLGHRGHGMFERWLLGSVSRTVIAYAPCAVMVVR